MAILTLNTRSRCASPEAAKVIHPVSLFLRQARRHRNGVISILRLALSTCVLAGIALTSHVLAQGPSEYQVKAAFLYNFAKFIEWPSGTFTTPSDPIVIGIVGDDPFGGVIEDTIRGKTVNGRSLAVRRFRPGQDLKTCHILFVSSSEGAHVSLILESLKGSGVLTVGEWDGFAEQGGIIRLVTDDNRVRFEINIDVAEQAPLKISSKLLNVAKVVHDERRQGKS